MGRKRPPLAPSLSRQASLCRPRMPTEEPQRDASLSLSLFHDTHRSCSEAPPPTPRPLAPTTARLYFKKRSVRERVVPMTGWVAAMGWLGVRERGRRGRALGRG